MIQFLKALLGEMPVLTMFASQVATRAGDAESKMAGNKMVKGCFFNRAYINDRRFTVNESV